MTQEALGPAEAPPRSSPGSVGGAALSAVRAGEPPNLRAASYYGEGGAGGGSISGCIRRPRKMTQISEALIRAQRAKAGMTHQAPYWSLCGIPCAVAIPLYANMTPMLNGIVPTTRSRRRSRRPGGRAERPRQRPQRGAVRPARDRPGPAYANAAVTVGPGGKRSRHECTLVSGFGCVLSLTTRVPPAAFCRVRGGVCCPSPGRAGPRPPLRVPSPRRKPILDLVSQGGRESHEHPDHHQDWDGHGGDAHPPPRRGHTAPNPAAPTRSSGSHPKPDVMTSSVEALTSPYVAVHL